jgi:hypothetical protein
MGYGLTNPVRSTVINWSNQTGANGAVSTDFAPVLQLLHPLIGEGQLEQVEQRLSRARSSALPAAPRPAGAYGWPTMALACSADRRTQRATYRAAWFEKGGIDLITGPCVSIFANRVDNPRQHRRGLSASALVEYQARNGGSAFPCASQQSDKPVCSPHNPLRHNGTQRHHHLFDDHKGFYARAGCAGGTWKTPAICRFPTNKAGWGAGGGKTQAAAVLRPASQISRPFFPEFFGSACSEKVGRPVKPPALTQGSGWIRQISLAATHLAQISKHAPAVNSESRRGMSP